MHEHCPDPVARAGLTPNWFASVMGTGIIAIAASSLPVQFGQLHHIAVALWALAAGLLITLIATTGREWFLDRAAPRRQALDRVMSHFYGAVPMAVLTVGAGTLLVGREVIGARAAVDLDWLLWTAGTIGGLGTAVLIPYLLFTRHSVGLQDAFGGWLMPIVPPMVSASTGALLVPHAAAGQLRLTLLMCCYAMFGLSLIASAVVITLIWLRLAVHGVGEPRMVPTLWIVLGPLGQSVTAANLLGGVAHEALPEPYASALQAFGVVYGVPAWGFAMLWAALAVGITVRTARTGLPFSLTWWSFTFPVGTCVTAASGLALHTGADLFRYTAVIWLIGLVAAWAVVATRTAHGVATGRLLGRWFSAPTVAGSPTSRRQPAPQPGG